MRQSSPRLLFGDVLAQAREQWVREMAHRLARQNFPDYRRSDALVLRWLSRTPLPLGQLTSAMGITRQGGRKVVSGLVERGFATVLVDVKDSRKRIVALTGIGRTFARAVIDTLNGLNAELTSAVDPEQLDAARAVLGYIRDNFGF